MKWAVFVVIGWLTVAVISQDSSSTFDAAVPDDAAVPEDAANEEKSSLTSHRRKTIVREDLFALAIDFLERFYCFTINLA